MEYRLIYFENQANAEHTGWYVWHPSRPTLGPFDTTQEGKRAAYLQNEEYVKDLTVAA